MTRCNGVGVKGGRCNDAGGGEGLGIVKWMDLVEVVESGVFEATDAESVVIDGTTFYKDAGAAEMRILAVTDAVAISELGVFDTTGDAQSVAIDGTTAYVADGADVLLVLDVIVSASPERVAVYETDGPAQLVTLPLAGTTAYASDVPNGVVAIDVTVPSLGNHASSASLS